MRSPRRSSRARSTAQPSSHSSSSSSSARSRHSRHQENDSHADADFNHRGGDASEAANADDTAEASNGADDDMMDGGDGEDEITRCICGYQEYQGGDDDQSDTDGLFIQCDQCSVWQHGFCVGITDPDSTPENYYCEQCRPDFHRLTTNKAGMKTSVYLPSEEPPKSATIKESSHKRRTTMNSRDADYNEAIFNEILEKSKHDAKAPVESSRTSNSRGKKRSTSEASDEPKPDSKRARTSNSPDNNSAPVEEAKSHKGSHAPSSTKKGRGTSGKNSTTNSSSTNKRSSARNKNAEKHESKKEDSDHSDQSNSRKKKKSPAAETNLAPPPPPNTDSMADAPLQPTKRSARNSHATGGTTTRRRNNRQTRQSEDPHDSVTSPMIREHSSTGRSNAASVLEKPTKPRLPQARMSMNEMKKRVSGISEYITRTQIELANMGDSDVYAYLAYLGDRGFSLNNGTPHSNSSKAVTPTSASNGTNNEKSIPQIQINGTAAGTENVLAMASEALSNGLTAGAVEMMELLSSKINRWQQQYGERV